MTREVVVPIARLHRWFEGFIARNGNIRNVTTTDQGVEVHTDRGGLAMLPPQPVQVTSLDELISVASSPGTAVLALIRRGGYSIAVADYAGPEHQVRASKTGSRYVQGRTAAGGQSQQRFARRRSNQADALVDAAVAAAARVLTGQQLAVDLLVTGGDAGLLRALLDRDPLRQVRAARTVHVATGEPRRASIDEALLAARAIRITVSNAPSQEDH